MVEIHEIPSSFRPGRADNPGAYAGSGSGSGVGSSSPPVNSAGQDAPPAVDIGQIVSQLFETWQEMEYAQKQQVGCDTGIRVLSEMKGAHWAQTNLKCFFRPF